MNVISRMFVFNVFSLQLPLMNLFSKLDFSFDHQYFVVSGERSKKLEKKIVPRISKKRKEKAYISLLEKHRWRSKIYRYQNRDKS